jgi:hypothetical protein
MKENLVIFLIVFLIFLVSLLAGLGLYFARRLLLTTSSETGDTVTVTATLESGSSGSDSTD